MLDLSEYPRFSPVERERRWNRVRELMRQQSCDCIVAPGTGNAEPARYLSPSPISAWVIFPLSGEVTAIVGSDRNREFAARAQDWVTDLRVGNPSELVPARLRELKLDGARIGLTQLEGLRRSPEGDIPYETMRRLQAALPRAGFQAADDILDEARLVKGPEEISVIERVAGANEEGIRVLTATARVGMAQQDVWFPVAYAMARATGAWPSRLSVTFGGPANQTLGLPIPDRIPAGSLCSQEIAARLQGYQAQSNHTVQVGDGGPADYAGAMRATIEVYNEMVAWLRPGWTVKEVCEHYVGLCARHGAEDASGVVVHSNGLGDDYPRVGPRMMGASEGSVVLRPGMTFTLKPVLKLPTGTRTQYGDPLTITEGGARRLGKRAQEPIVVSS